MFNIIFWIYQCIWKLAFTFSFIRSARDLMTVLTLYTSFQNKPVYLQIFTSGNCAVVSLSYLFHIQYPAFHSLIVFKLLIVCNICYSGLCMYAVKLSQEDFSPVCVICYFYVPVLPLALLSVPVPVTLSLTVYWIYPDANKSYLVLGVPNYTVCC